MAERYRLSALAYTSRATRALSAEDIARIKATASRTNALDGVTGLLLFTGTNFAQIVEGAQTAIDALVHRLNADERHRDIRVHFAKPIERRSFPSWDMKVVELSPDRDAALERLSEMYPPAANPEIKEEVRALVASCYE